MADYPQIDLSAWQQVGEGGNGKTYENPEKPGVLLKVNNKSIADLRTVKEEFNLSKAVESVGIQTPRMYEIVRVGESYATLCEKIQHKKSLSRICSDQPERLKEMAQLFCEEGCKFFSTPCDTKLFRNRKELALEGIEKSLYLPRKKREALTRFVQSVPENKSCSHGDFQPGNILLSEGKCYWIDLGRFAWGDPMFDIGHLYNACMVYSNMKKTQEIFHMTEQQFADFWDAFAKAYTGQEDHSEFDLQAARFGAVDIAMRTVFQAPSFPEKIFFRLKISGLMKRAKME